MTGHKVLTTFHTEDSIGGLLRLMNMDIETFLISSTVVCVIAQRLLRKIYSECSETYEPSHRQIRQLGYGPDALKGVRFAHGLGCERCRHTGYKGRVGVFELLVLDENVRQAILERKTSQEIRRSSVEASGLVTLLEGGIVKTDQGITSFDEIMRSLPRMAPPRPLQDLHRLLGE